MESERDAPGLTNSPLASTNLPELMAISGLTAVAWYNVVELNVSIYMTFKRRRGLYFWCLLISSWGILFHSTGLLFKLFGVIKQYEVTCTIITIGWWSMVTGQALVLYSRLHLVVKDTRILRGVLIMIIWNAITLHIPTTVLTYGSNSPAHDKYITGYSVMEKVQMTCFCLQEYIISGIYMWATLRLLNPGSKKRTRSVMMQLLWINVIIIIMDIAMLVMEYLQQYVIQTAMKSMVYSVKLKLEFAVLNQLMRLANSSRHMGLYPGQDDNIFDSRNSSHHQSKGIAGFIRRILPGRNPFLDESGSSISPTGTRIDTSGEELGSGGYITRSQVNARMRQRGSGDLDELPYAGAPRTTKHTELTVFSSKPLDNRQQRCISLSLEQMREGQTPERNFYNNPAAFCTSSRRQRRLDPLDIGDSDEDEVDDTILPAPSSINEHELMSVSTDESTRRASSTHEHAVLPFSESVRRSGTSSTAHIEHIELCEPPAAAKKMSGCS